LYLLKLFGIDWLPYFHDIYYGFVRKRCSRGDNSIMKLMRKCIVCVILFIFIIIAAVVSCSSQTGSISDTIPVQPKGSPIKIGVCMPSGGTLAALAARQEEGIRAAFQYANNAGGRPVELIFKDLGNSAQEFGKVVDDLTGKDKVSAIIACISPETASLGNDILKTRPIPLIITSPASIGKKTETDPKLINLSTTLEDQAIAGARFVNTLGAQRLGVILDPGDPICVRLASLFSAHVVKNGGRIVDVAYLKKDEDPSRGLNHLVEEKPDAVYAPFSSSTTAAMITKMRAMNKQIPIVVSNVQLEETLLSEIRDPLEKVYILTDFHEQAVQSPRGRNFIEFYHKKLKKKEFVTFSIAMGADAYFLAVDMGLNDQKPDIQSMKTQDMLWNASMLGITGVTPSGSLRNHLSVCRVDEVFLHGTILKYVGQVEVSDLNAGTDVRAQ
jgi:ABC-type branched-subunit amino acid transport system substrate-binding protein